MKTLEQSTMKAEKTTAANKVSQTKQQLWDRNTDSWKMVREWAENESLQRRRKRMQGSLVSLIFQKPSKDSFKDKCYLRTHVK